MSRRLPKRQREAPALQLEVRVPFSWRLCFVLLWALALCSAGAAASAQAADKLGPGASTACQLMTLLLLPLVCWLAWRHRAREVWQLLWDGQQWALRAGDARGAALQDAVLQAVTIQVSLDFGDFLLLGCRPAGGARGATVYLPLSKAQHPGLWRPLRWALFSARGLRPDAA
ncbi:hypothetical protein H5407_03345 [Mitsuaria sp. WAJ17]|uniref:hypothetical protein n=1 Tax=Mitsuaria sp. WAJ17 TaxID=2761452 RepID=UPI0015FF7FCD|nr:hypothetical protein [Mitsuaria sp. WAJ17]MBB2484256.1 hypothetical protein [Mitsuaria sp. WAJ17]